MENHLHWVASAEDLSAQVARFKSYTARRIIDTLEREHPTHGILEQFRFYKLRHKTDQIHQVWQEVSHPKQITRDAMVEQKLDYVHQNPVRRGYVDDPAHWRYSSARNYAGQEGLIDVEAQW